MNRASILRAAGLAVAVSLASLSPAQGPVSFDKDIRPIFETSCWACHGAAIQSAKLDLRSREFLLKGGDHGPAIIPGNGEKSRLYRMMAGLDQPAMPLNGARLTAKQIAAIKTWIDEGAHWDTTDVSAVQSPANPAAALENEQLPPGARDYWAFKLPVQAPVPNVGAPYQNPIDRFLEKARREKGLKAAQRADRNTLVRRAYLDLIGMPPTPEQAAQFLADTKPGAWGRLIDSLLASPHYGERWGRYWLDVARYADSSGFEYDFDQPNSWRYRDYVVSALNNDKPFDRFLKEQIAGDELPDRNNESYIATYFLRAGPRVNFREKDYPELRYEYLDDIIATVGRGVLGLTVQCARCHDHKFDPILQRDYYALEASLAGYVETDFPLVPKAEAEDYRRKMAEINAQEFPLRLQIREIEAPYVAKLTAEAIRSRFSKSVQDAYFKPESQRTQGDYLLLSQIPDALLYAPLPVDQALSPEDAARRRGIKEQIQALERGRPPAIPMAEIATDGDYRSTPDRLGDDVVGCPHCRIPDPKAGPFLTTGDETYEPPPSYFLVRGDVNSKGGVMKPGFIAVATYNNPPTVLPPADRHTSGRRLALAAWLTSRDNPLPARVMVNRIWAHHFGRGIVASLDNFGRMGEQPTNQELLDWLAVEFMNRGWSVKQMQRLMLTSEAYQMASNYADAADEEKDPENHYLWRYRARRLDSEAIRDSILATGGAINLKLGGPPVYPPMPKELLATTVYNPWREQKDGPDVWRRSIYVYRKRNLAFPMLEAFDMPDANVTAGARNVSTVSTQALMLLNDEFVRHQARLLADRVTDAAPSDPRKQIDLIYRIALTRPPDEGEFAVAKELVDRQGLTDLAHVVLNLNEFLYLR